MPTRLIRLVDGTFVEVEVTATESQQISSTAAKRVEESIDKIKPILLTAVKPIAAAWKEMRQDMDVDHAEVELGLSFEGEGNVYITKAKAGANLVIKLHLKPRPEGTDHA